MCHTRTITYACGHTCAFRLSTCRGVFTYHSRRTRKSEASCVSVALITFKSGVECGPCSRDSAEAKLNDELEATRKRLTPTDWAAERPAELGEAEEEYGHQQHLIYKRFPDGRYKKTGRPEKGEMSTCAGPKRLQSLLRVEVKPEDVVTGWTPNKYAVGGGWDDEDWGGGWKSLEEELAESEAERAEMGLGPTCTMIDAWEINEWNESEQPGAGEDPELEEETAVNFVEDESKYSALSLSVLDDMEPDAIQATEETATLCEAAYTNENIPPIPDSPNAPLRTRTNQPTTSQQPFCAVQPRQSSRSRENHKKAAHLLEQMHLGPPLAVSN